MSFRRPAPVSTNALWTAILYAKSSSVFTFRTSSRSITALRIHDQIRSVCKKTNPFSKRVGQVGKLVCLQALPILDVIRMRSSSRQCLQLGLRLVQTLRNTSGRSTELTDAQNSGYSTGPILVVQPNQVDNY